MTEETSVKVAEFPPLSVCGNLWESEGEYLDANTSSERHLKEDDILAEFLVRWSESRSNDVPLAGGSIYRRNHRPSLRGGSVPCEFEKICFLQLNFSL